MRISTQGTFADLAARLSKYTPSLYVSTYGQLEGVAEGVIDLLVKLGLEEYDKQHISDFAEICARDLLDELHATPSPTATGTIFAENGSGVNNEEGGGDVEASRPSITASDVSSQTAQPNSPGTPDNHEAQPISFRYPKVTAHQGYFANGSQVSQLSDHLLQEEVSTGALQKPPSETSHPARIGCSHQRDFSIFQGSSIRQQSRASPWGVPIFAHKAASTLGEGNLANLSGGAKIALDLSDDVFPSWHALSTGCHAVGNKLSTAWPYPGLGPARFRALEAGKSCAAGSMST